MKYSQWNLLSNDAFYDGICKGVLLVAGDRIGIVFIKIWRFLKNRSIILIQYTAKTGFIAK